MSKETMPQNLTTPAVSRRSFLFGLGATAAVVAGGSLAGCAPQGSEAAPAAATPADTETMAATGGTDSDLMTDTVQDALAKAAKNQESKEADIVVVGSGIAGMSCAVEAALAGAKVIILEKNDTMTGGDSSICTGNFYCCGSAKQDSMGYTDYGTAEEIAQFLFDQSDGDANMDICRMVAENGGAAMDWLVSFGCDFDKKPGDGVSDRSMVSTNGGKGIIDTLIGVAEANGAELMMGARALQIIMENGRAAGVVARQGDTDFTISTKAVMLACGGFDGEDWSKQLYAPGTVGWHTFSTPTNTGDGIELAREAGALTLLKGGLSQIHLVGRDPLPLNDELSKLRMVNTGVFVTDLGYRCANESMTSQFDYFVPFVQSGRKEFTIICDSQQPAERMELIKKAVEVGVASTADTIADLAVAAELPQYPLVKTIEHYNELCAAGEDPDFHKNPEDLQALTQAPFYAIQITPNTNDSFGQLAISTKAEVLDESRQPVPGLYAGGTIANAELFYMRYAVSGASMCMGTVTGRIAAQEAMKYYGA